MATIKADFGWGHANLAPQDQGSPTLADALRDVATDLGVLRTSITTLTAKIDADSGDTGGDNNYAALCDPVAMLTIKG